MVSAWGLTGITWYPWRMYARTARLPYLRRSPLAPTTTTVGDFMTDLAGRGKENQSRGKRFRKKRKPSSPPWPVGQGKEEGNAKERCPPGLQGAAARVGGLVGNDNGGRRRFRVGLAVNGVVHLLPMDRHFLGSNNAETDLVAADFHHRHGDVIVDDD